MSKSLLLAASALVASLFLAGAAVANPTKDLAGRWTGGGQITLSGGGTEQLKCVATYQVSGSSVRQALRCASSSYKIDSVANLSISGSSVSGDWSENTYSASGGVSGRTTASGFNLSIRGPTFGAAMQVSTGACRQSIYITPSGLDVSRISLSLGKC
jgi:opacity protein-like surface antigen